MFIKTKPNEASFTKSSWRLSHRNHHCRIAQNSYDDDNATIFLWVYFESHYRDAARFKRSAVRLDCNWDHENECATRLHLHHVNRCRASNHSDSCGANKPLSENTAEGTVGFMAWGVGGSRWMIVHNRWHNKTLALSIFPLKLLSSKCCTSAQIYVHFCTMIVVWQ